MYLSVVVVVLVVLKMLKTENFKAGRGISPKKFQQFLDSTGVEKMLEAFNRFFNILRTSYEHGVFNFQTLKC